MLSRNRSAIPVRAADQERLLPPHRVTRGLPVARQSVTQVCSNLNREALPPEILEDDRYWKISTTRIVRTVPVREETSDPLIDDDDI